MDFKLTREFSGKVFQKVGSIAQSELDLSSKSGQIDFSVGFVDFLQKEANMSPEMGLGVISFFCEKGAEWLEEQGATDGTEKQAFWEGITGAKDKVLGSIGNFLSPVIQPKMNEAVSKAIGEQVGGIKDTISQYGGKAWDYLKSPEFLTNVAPMLVGGLAGALIPKALNSNAGMASTGLGAAGGALLGDYLINSSRGQADKSYADRLRKHLIQYIRS
jgi:hypothetical protein